MALGKDLAEIREELGVDMTIQGLTKLSYEIISEIESDAIFNSKPTTRRILEILCEATPED